jgi:hypothetical protein
VLKLERPDLYAGPAASAWANLGIAGAARNLAQASTAIQPCLIPMLTPAGGPAVDFDGVGDVFNGSWAQAQPTHTFASVLPSVAGIDNSGIWDGATNSSQLFYVFNGSTELAAYAGARIVVVSPSTSWVRAEALYNGVSGRLRINDLTPTVGDTGTAAPNGLSLGARGPAHTFYADCRVAERITYSVARSTAEQERLHSYLRQHGV